MADAAGALGRRQPNPSPAASLPAPAPAPLSARRPDAPPRGAQATACQGCGGRSGPGNVTRCQCTKAAKHAQNEVHQVNEAVFKTKSISRPDSSDKYRMHKSSGGTYSKPEARVKLIPLEDITYVHHRKPFGRTVTSDGLQKKHCKRSVTPPPSSRKVSLVRPASLTQNPTPSASTVATCHFPKRLETAENGRPLVRGCATSSLARKTASIKNCTPASCKAVLSQPSGTTLITASKTFSSKNSREAFAKSCSSSILHKQDHSSAIPPASLVTSPISPGLKISPTTSGSKISPTSPGSVNVLAAHSNSSEVLATKAKSSSKSVCTSDNGKLGLTSCDVATFSLQRVRTAAAGIVQNVSVEPKLLSPTSVRRENSSKVYPYARSRASSGLNLPNVKCKPASLQCERIVPPIQRLQSIAPAQNVELFNDIQAGPSSKSRSSTEKQTNQEVSIDCNTSLGTPVILHTKLHKKHYQPEARWKGKFEVIGELTCTCDGLEAHFPSEVFEKVYEASKQMPETLKLEALPLSRLWPKIFKIKPPDGQDIGLCFINSARPNRNFDHLLESTSSHIGLRIDIGTIELLIFSSELLTQDYQTKDDKLYLWGVFRNHHRKKQHRYNNRTNNASISNTHLSNGGPCHRSEEIGMNLDLTRGKEANVEKCEIGMKLDARGSKENDRGKSKDNDIKLDVEGDRETERVNKCLTMLKTPDSNAAASCTAPSISLFNGHHSPDSTYSPCQSATRATDSDLLELDTPPGFPLDIPPGFTKDDCRFTRATGSDLMELDTPPGFPLDIPPGFTKDDCLFRLGETAESCISPSLVLDTPGFSLDIPPGFTSADQQLPTITSDGSEAGVSSPGSEKKPIISFSLNVRKPLQTVVLPGFTRLNPVKKEPGLPAVCEATGKTTPIGKVDDIKTKHEVKVDMGESSEEREFPKSKLLSDILISPTTKEAHSSFKVIPRNCTEVRRSKRAQQEPPEPSGDATKRPKVVAPNIFR